MARQEVGSGERNTPVAVKRGESPILAFQEEMNNLFSNFFGETLPHWWHSASASVGAISPATDVAETDKEIRITAELPGLDSKDVNVTINDQYVTIRGQKTEESQEEGAGYFRQERSYGEFRRILPLPVGMVNAEKAEASMNRGLLTITVPKKAEAQQPKARQLDIKQVA